MSVCGIFGFVGAERSVPLTVGSALKSLEYRGYDSWGIVWREEDRLTTVKRIGRVPTAFTFDAISRIAVGHTRWATHGGVTEFNAHPHLDGTGRVAIVHNGIIENAAALRSSLQGPPAFASETDSEIVAHLLGERVAAGEGIGQAMRYVFPLLEGQNAVIAIDQHEEVIAAAMNVSPLIIGLGTGDAFITSDPFALVGKTKEMVIAPSGAVVELSPDGVRAFDYVGAELPLPARHPVPDVSLDELGEHSHFMAKEMAEQPEVIRHQLRDGESSVRLAAHIDRAEHVILTGCGSAYYAARIGSTWLSTLAGRRSQSVPASEFVDVAPFLGKGTLVLAITQSGETADILEAMGTAIEAGSNVVALVNVTHSSAARLAHDVIPLLAGRERSVLATKSLLAMLARLLAATGHLSGTDAAISGGLEGAATELDRLAATESFRREIEAYAGVIATAEHVYVIGKGDGYGVAQEAALKIKEASYVHAEAFAAGELKHGAIALIEPGSPCLGFTTDQRFATDTGSSMQELRSRGGYTMSVGQTDGDGCCRTLPLEDLGPANVLVQIFVAQNLAYRVALLRQVDPDYPRNLAKSVTVK